MTIRECCDLCGADKGEIQRVEKEHNVLALHSSINFIQILLTCEGVVKHSDAHPVLR